MPHAKRLDTEVPLKLVGQLLLVLIGAILALRVSTVSVYIMLLFVIYTLNQKKVEFSFFAVMLLVALAIMNPIFFVKDRSFYMITRLSLLVLAVGLGIKTSRQPTWFLRPFSLLYAYMACIMVTSFWGWAPLISFLKAVLFLVFMLALIKGVAAVVQKGVDIRFVRAGMLAIACFFILGSIAVIPFPSVGKSLAMTNISYWMIDATAADIQGLFNGLTWHPQTLGPTLAMLNAFLLSDYLCNFKRRHWLYRVLLAGIPVLIFMSSSRTALFSYLISILSVVLFFQSERHVPGSKRQRVLIVCILLGLAGTMVLSFHPRTSARMHAFLRKSRDPDMPAQGTTVSESLMASRMGMFEMGWANFLDRPLFGNGFQVSPAMKGYNFFEHGFVFTAPVEKGVLLTMIFEEGGLLGAFLFLSFLIALYSTYRRLAFTCFLSTFTVFLGLNSGEAAFFSTSGGGGILWMTCFCAMLMDIHRHRRRLAETEQRREQIGRVSAQYALADA